MRTYLDWRLIREFLVNLHLLVAFSPSALDFLCFVVFFS